MNSNQEEERYQEIISLLKSESELATKELREALKLKLSEKIRRYLSGYVQCEANNCHCKSWSPKEDTVSNFTTSCQINLTSSSTCKNCEHSRLEHSPLYSAQDGVDIINHMLKVAVDLKFVTKFCNNDEVGGSYQLVFKSYKLLLQKCICSKKNATLAFRENFKSFIQTQDIGRIITEHINDAFKEKKTLNIMKAIVSTFINFFNSANLHVPGKIAEFATIEEALRQDSTMKWLALYELPLRCASLDACKKAEVLGVGYLYKNLPRIGGDFLKEMFEGGLKVAAVERQNWVLNFLLFLKLLDYKLSPENDENARKRQRLGARCFWNELNRHLLNGRKKNGRAKLLKIIKSNENFVQELVQELTGESDVPGCSDATPGRDVQAYVEEKSNEIKFHLVKSKSSGTVTRLLLQFCDLVKDELKYMKDDYLANLVYEDLHRAILIIKDEKVIGGAAFRPFIANKFIELTFLVISLEHQVGGYGTYLMNHLKDHISRSGFTRILTYADDTATRYFTKQSFRKAVSLPKQQYFGSIKYYNYATLMECKIEKEVRHTLSSVCLSNQKQFIAKITVSRVVRKPKVIRGLNFTEGQVMNMNKIPGLSSKLMAKFNKKKEAQSNNLLKEKGLYLSVLKQLKAHKHSWPFVEPVSTEVVPDYYDVVKNPMDLQTMCKNVEIGKYTSKREFVGDVQKIFDNCRHYNKEDTAYYSCANKLEKFFFNIVKKLDGL